MPLFEWSEQPREATRLARNPASDIIEEKAESSPLSALHA
jgi:hypothetical protein